MIKAAGGLMLLFLLTAPMLGIFTQPWAGWYFPNPNAGVHRGGR